VYFSNEKPPCARRFRRWCCALCTVVAAATTFPRTSEAQELALDEALRLAQQRSSRLSAQAASANASREMAVSAGRLPDPVLKVGINNLPVTGADAGSVTSDFMTMRSIGVSQEFTREEKRKARATRFEREADAAAAGRALALANLQRDTAIAWLDRYYQERMRGVLIAQRDEATLQVEAADAAYRAGRGAQADVFAARSSVAQIEDGIAQSERQIATATTQLARWIGDPAGRTLAAPPLMDSVSLDATDLQLRLEHHPQLAVMARQEDVARAEADIARADKRADWSVEVMYSQRGPSYSNMISLNVSVPVQWDQKNRQDRELAARLAMTERMRAQREEATREHTAEVRVMLQEWQSNHERLKRYDGSLIPLVAERTRAALAAYRGGTGTLASVLEARRSEIDTRMERLRLDMDSARLWAQLNYLIPANHDVATSRP
jgi:outer membrane protein TolC